MKANVVAQKNKFSFAGAFPRRRRLWVSALVALFTVLCFHTAQALGQDIILEFTDKPDPVTPEQVKEWIEKANAGDWELILEFAAAYLYPDKCQKLKYGHRCRAMTVRSDEGANFYSRY